MRVAFSLIELIVVILIMGLVSFLVLKLPSLSFKKDISNWAEYKDLKVLVYENGDINSTKDISFNCKDVEVFEFLNGEFVKKDFGNLVFEYERKRGIGDSFILRCDEKFYVFKPFDIKRVSGFEEAKREFLDKRFIKEDF